MDLNLAVPAYRFNAKLGDVQIRVPTETDHARLALKAAGNIVGQQSFLGGWARKPSPEFEREFMRNRAKRFSTWGRRNQWVLDLIVLSKNEEAGNIVVGPHPMRDGALASAIWIRHDLQGRGIGTKALRLVLEAGFGFLDAHSFEMEISIRNEKSIHIHQNVGFSSSGQIVHPDYGPVHRMVLRNEDRQPSGAATVNGSDLRYVAALPI